MLLARHTGFGIPVVAKSTSELHWIGVGGVSVAESDACLCLSALTSFSKPLVYCSRRYLSPFARLQVRDGGCCLFALPWAFRMLPSLSDCH